jgi:peptidoglycan/LPS O-acetylase OafA/YrhL
VITASRRVGPVGPAAEQGRVLGLTRAGVWVLLVLAAANGLFLYVFPGRADTDYAWSIQPAVNAGFIGAGFLAGTLATGLVLQRAARWRSFSLLPAALWVLASALLAATIIHADRFKWDYPLTWLWALVYAGVPLAVPFLAARQRRVAEPLPATDSALVALRVLSGITGAGLIVGAAASYVAPVELDEHWPWALTPLLARAVAAWYALFGTMLLTFALAQRRRCEGLIGHATLAAWCALLLALPLLHPDDVSGRSGWYAVMVMLLALALYGLKLGWPERHRL